MRARGQRKDAERDRGRAGSADSPPRLPWHARPGVFVWLAAVALVHSSSALSGGGGKDRVGEWRGTIETFPEDRQIVNEGQSYVLACRFSIDPPPGGSFTMYVNAVHAYEGSSPDTELHARLATGQWHTVSCSVMDQGSKTLAARSSTFLVRKGASVGAHLGDAGVRAGGHVWVQRHDACGEEWEDVLEDGVQPGLVPALDALHTCSGEDDAEYELGVTAGVRRHWQVEGLVDHVTWYPPHAERLLEERFFEFYVSNWRRFPKDMVYVPIMWISHNHNRQLFSPAYRPTVFDLAEHVRRKYSDPKKRYFTVMQADELHPELKDAMPSNCLIFSASSYGHFTLPLTTQFHDSRPAGIGETIDRPFLASFLGRNTHPIRGALIRLYSEDPDFIIFSPGFPSSMMNINQENQGLFRYVTTMSVFTLCPRGNGPSSFRIFESLEHGSIPVYIYDEDACFPFSDVIEWSAFAVLIHHKDLVNLKELLLSFSQDEIESMQQRGAEVLDRYFSLNGTHNYILETLKRIDREWRAPEEPPKMRSMSLASTADSLLQSLSRRLIEHHGDHGLEHPFQVSAGQQDVRSRGAGKLSALQAVSGGMMMLRRCIAQGFQGNSCGHAFALANLENGHHSALYLRGLLHLYLNGDKFSSQKFFLASLSVSPAHSMGMFGLEMMYGRAQDINEDVQRALMSAQLLDSSPIFRRYAVHQTKVGEKFCMTALHGLHDGTAGERHLVVAHAVLACRSVAGQRILVMPEEIFGEFDDERLERLVPLMGYESLQQTAQQTYILQPQSPLTARLMYASDCFAKSHGCTGLFDTLDVRWEASAPLIPAYKLRAILSGLEHVEVHDVETMTTGFQDDDVIALDPVPLMHDLHDLQRCAGLRLKAKTHLAEGLQTQISAPPSAFAFEDSLSVCNMDFQASIGLKDVASNLRLPHSAVQESAGSAEPCGSAASVLIYIERATEGEFSGALAERIMETLITLTKSSRTTDLCGLHILSNSAQVEEETFVTAFHTKSKEAGLHVVRWENVDVHTYEGLAILHARAVKSHLFMGTRGSAATASALLLRCGKEEFPLRSFSTF